MKKLILFIILIINILPLISQNGYPKEVILNKDTLLAFTYNQVREINKGLEEGEGCKSELLVTEKLVLTYDSLVKDGTLLVQNLNNQILTYTSIVKDQNEKYNLKNKQYEKSIKANKTNKTIFSVFLGILGTGLTALGIYIGTK
jgi:hypothetical protein